MAVAHMGSSPRSEETITAFPLQHSDPADQLLPPGEAKWQDGDSQSETLYDFPEHAAHHTTDLFGGATYAVVNHDHASAYPYDGLGDHRHALTVSDSHMFSDSPFLQPVMNERSVSPQSQFSSLGSGRPFGSGRSTTKSTSPSIGSRPQNARVSKSRSRKARTALTLEALGGVPLSEWAKRLDIEPRDVETQVKRPHHERATDSGSKKGGIKRPMNQFLLYRSAYTVVAQAYGQEEGKNHQWVSKMCGLSWAHETPEVHAHFKRLATDETAHHKAVFPEYKYEPNSNKRVDDGADDLDDDPDGEYRPGARNRASATRRVKEESPYFSDSFGGGGGGGGTFDTGELDGRFDFDGGLGGAEWDVGRLAARSVPMAGPNGAAFSPFGAPFMPVDAMGRVLGPAGSVAPMMGMHHAHEFGGYAAAAQPPPQFMAAAGGAHGQMDPSLLQIGGSLEERRPDAHGQRYPFVDSSALFDEDETPSQFQALMAEQ